MDVNLYFFHKPSGEGARWSCDRRQAWRLNDGKPAAAAGGGGSGRIPLSEAAQIAQRLGMSAESLDRIVYAGTFEGKRVDGKRSGPGRMKMDWGDEYDGMWMHGKQHGKGVMTYDNGDTYNGPWFKGLRHGISGTMTYTTGDSYTGRWEMDEPHGMGVYTWVPGGTSADGDGGGEDGGKGGDDGGAATTNDGEEEKTSSNGSSSSSSSSGGGGGEGGRGGGGSYEGWFYRGQKHVLGVTVREGGGCDVSQYDRGAARGEGVRWSRDRLCAWLLDEGVPVEEVSLADAAAAAELVRNDVGKAGFAALLCRR